MPRLTSSGTAASCSPDSPDSWCESLVASDRTSHAGASFRRIADEPAGTAPTGVGWKRKSEMHCSRGDTRARLRSAHHLRWRYECRCAAKSGVAGVFVKEI